jgi:hypothetical protein
VIAYPNSGEVWDAGRRAWTGQSLDFAGQLGQWVAAGARIAGGCCRVRPDDITVMAQAAADLGQAPAGRTPIPRGLESPGPRKQARTERRFWTRAWGSQPRYPYPLRQDALTTLIVHWPAACTLKDSASPGVTPVISVLPDPEVAMSFGRLPPKAFGSVAEIEKLVAPPMLGSVLLE